MDTTMWRSSLIAGVKHMSVETTYTYETILVAEEDSPCPNIGRIRQAYANKLVAIEEYSDNEKDSREYPDPPLWKSPTAIPVQHTWKQFAGTQEVVTFMGPNPLCYNPFGWGLVSIYNRYDYERPLVPVNLVDMPEPDWALAARKKIKQQSVNLAGSIAEYRQTATTFYDFAKATHDETMNMASSRRKYRGKWRNRYEVARQLVCSMSAIELIRAFGLKPLISDLANSATALQEKLLAEDIWWKIRVKAKESDHSPLFHDDYYEYTRVVSSKAVLYILVNPQDRGNFTAGNPLEVLWEATPFSFVVDWAIPLGDWLSSLDALVGVKQIIGTVTHKSEVNCKQISESRPGGVMLTPGTAHYKSFSREVVTDIPLPRFPEYSPSKSWHSIKNAMALLTSINCHKPRKKVKKKK
jgi:hypothetical protein